MSSDRQSRIRSIVADIRRSPYPDGNRTFTLDLPPAVLFVRVEEDYTIYYGVVGYPGRDEVLVQVYEIKETTGPVQEMLRSPWE